MSDVAASAGGGGTPSHPAHASGVSGDASVGGGDDTGGTHSRGGGDDKGRRGSSGSSGSSTSTVSGLWSVLGGRASPLNPTTPTAAAADGAAGAASPATSRHILNLATAASAGAILAFGSLATWEGGRCIASRAAPGAPSLSYIVAAAATFGASMLSRAAYSRTDDRVLAEAGLALALNQVLYWGAIDWGLVCPSRGAYAVYNRA